MMGELTQPAQRRHQRTVIPPVDYLSCPCRSGEMRATPVDRLKELLTKVPLDEAQQATAAELVQKCSSQELASLGLSAPARPTVPKLLDKLPMPQRLAAIQKVITSIEYNHKPGYMYNVSKDRPFCRIMDTAREVLREALPIKCVEAVFLGALLTAGWDGLQRIPMRFKSNANGQIYKHIVLVIHHVPSQKWGALGISRRQELMYKELSFDSLSALVLDFKEGYEKWWHKLQKASLGLPFDHDVFSNGAVCWRSCSISPSKHSWRTCEEVLNKFADEYKSVLNKFKVVGYVTTRTAKTDSTQSCTPAAGKAASGAPSAPAAAPISRASRSVSPTRRKATTAKQHAGSPSTKKPVELKAKQTLKGDAHPPQSPAADASSTQVQPASGSDAKPGDEGAAVSSEGEDGSKHGDASPEPGSAAAEQEQSQGTSSMDPDEPKPVSEGGDRDLPGGSPRGEAAAADADSPAVEEDSDTEDESDGDYDDGRD